LKIIYHKREKLLFEDKYIDDKKIKGKKYDIRKKSYFKIKGKGKIY